ncbi:class I SAM-dependent methyltransferase [Halocynthiibacter sp. C4]|uniref:class I SAM-dependent methyltransferase n=1 Tax=Halocynthiibacter sp. C4 TaxID=2992758 RepID=UPI00237A8B02|nr:class I SAM-dependent methyltransferase [Halocynthiibacter sp. C4]MDE0589841.1 class I SAM-dependent methyltransferase [Halocynthiibacter sp. C4]
MRPEDILDTYETHGPAYAARRNKTLFERRWLDRFLAHAPGRDILDVGCGGGLPIARYIRERNREVTGVDGAASMVTLFAENVPGATVHHADMRGLDLGKEFDGLIAWNSFFHLSVEDQRAMFPVFAAHAAPGAPLLVTTGPSAGEAIGEVEGAPIYHASLNPEDYHKLFDEAGFDVVDFVPEDPDCAGHSVWLARRRKG